MKLSPVSSYLSLWSNIQKKQLFSTENMYTVDALFYALVSLL